MQPITFQTAFWLCASLLLTACNSSPPKPEPMTEPSGPIVGGSAIVCGNAVAKPFHAAPVFFAPDETRARGILVNIDGGAGEPIRDRRAPCLPLPLRLNNPGAQKSVDAPGQTGSDAKGHATFATNEDGIAEIVRWVERRQREGKGSAFAMMSRYAPPDDCIGSVDKLPSGECPPGFPLNPTHEYAQRIAAALGKGPMDDLGLGLHKCADERRAIRIFVEEIMTFESGAAFCEGRCGISDAVFDAAVMQAWGPEPENCPHP